MAGSYKAIAGGQTGDALVDFTGGVSEDLQLVHKRIATDERKRELLYKVIPSGSPQLMGCE